MLLIIPRMKSGQYKTKTDILSTSDVKQFSRVFFHDLANKESESNGYTSSLVKKVKDLKFAKIRDLIFFVLEFEDILYNTPP